MRTVFRLLLSLILLPGFISSASAQIEELPLKAMFLEAAVRFITWPIDTADNNHFKGGNTFTIGIFENDGISPHLKKAFIKKRGADNPVRFFLVENLSQIDSCDMLFIPSDKSKTVQAILERTKGRPVLTVSDVPELIEEGIILGIVMQNKKISCLINTLEADSSHFKISYHLLQKSRVFPAKRDNK